MIAYLIDEDQLNKLIQNANALCNGTDKERDKGNALWLIIWEIQNQRIEQ